SRTNVGTLCWRALRSHWKKRPFLNAQPKVLKDLSPKHKLPSHPFSSRGIMCSTNIDALIFDLVPPKTLHAILQTPTWFDYERGRLTEDEAYEAVASKFDLGAQDVAVAFQGARDSLSSRPFMVDLIRDLKRDGGRCLPCPTSLHQTGPSSAPSPPTGTSSMPCTRRRRRASASPTLASSGTSSRRPASTRHTPAFVDDKFDNVLAARSFGMKGVVYDEFSNVQRTLRNICGNPVARGFAFMHEHAGRHVSFTSTGHVIQENFAQLLILEALGDPALVDYTKYDGPFNFFRGGGQFTTRNFPFDADTSSIGLTIAEGITEETKHRVMDEMLRLRNTDGILQVYFDPSRPRVDPIVCVNALCFFYFNGRGDELSETLDWVEAVLRHRAYLHGTRYYEPAEAFLYFLCRLLAISERARAAWRVNMPGDALALAMRVISCRALVSMPLQICSGSWRCNRLTVAGTRMVLQIRLKRGLIANR
ncbi:hypothetical protein BD626DRAFT_517959, partial [Schizophyllum amplum]